MKKIFEKALLDIIITVVILLTLFTGHVFIRWFLYLYTPVILAARIIALFSKKVKSSKGVSDWIFHLLYAINFTVLIIDRWWVLAGMWLLIWILAFLFSRKRSVQQQSAKRMRKR